MKTVDFLDAVKQRHELATDYQLAKFLRWPPGRVSMYRIGKRELDDEACMQIAAALEIPPAYVMACIAAARAKSAEVRRQWLNAAKLLKTGTAAAILGCVLAIEQPAPGVAQAATATKADSVYIMRRRRRAADRRRRWRRPRRKLHRVTAVTCE